MFCSSNLFAQAFHHIRIGDVDGMGYVTAMTPGQNGEPNWSFGSYYTQSPQCANPDGSLRSAWGLQANDDGLNVLQDGDHLPDLDCDSETHLNSDEFDNRTVAEWNDAYTEVSGCVNLSSTGSGFTDVALSPRDNIASTIGWNYGTQCPDSANAPSLCSVIPSFQFKFQVNVADIVAGQDVFVNVIFGDYDVYPMEIHFIDAVGNLTVGNLSTQNNGSGDDGLIQAASALLPFYTVFTLTGSTYTGAVTVEFVTTTEPFIAIDYVEINVEAMVEPVGCCCWQEAGGWMQQVVTPFFCANAGGTYSGDGTNCDGGVCGGSCCYVNADGIWTCTTSFTEQECYNQLYVYWLPGGDCSTINCEPPPPTGACCWEKGQILCSDNVSLDTCNSYGGSWFVNQSCVDVEPCSGACCYQDATGWTCQDYTTPQSCEEVYSGIFQGYGTTCNSVSCCPEIEPKGACCHRGDCIIATGPDCIAASGNYNGNGSGCTNTSCEIIADIDRDGFVGLSDLLVLIGAWGTTYP